MGSYGEDGLDASSSGTSHEESEDDCARADLEEGVSEETAIGNADAELFHQSSRARVERFAAGEIGNREITLVETNPTLAIWVARAAKVFSEQEKALVKATHTTVIASYELCVRGNPFRSAAPTARESLGHDVRHSSVDAASSPQPPR
ncbi:MAG: hypothetical protein WA361_06855 [Candidatus Acidiferrales bacterium]